MLLHIHVIVKVKVSSDTTQYPILRAALYYLADLFNQTPFLHLETFGHAAINSQRLLVHIHSPLYVTRYSVIQLSELDQCRVKKSAQRFTPQRWIRIRVLLVKNPKFYPCATVVQHVHVFSMCQRRYHIENNILYICKWTIGRN